MEQTVVKATTGREQGSRPSRRLRAAGQLPGVVYGLDREPQPIAVDYVELRDALSRDAGMNAVLSLDVEGTVETVLVRSVQRDPIKRQVTHADFLRIDPNQRVTVKVPIEVIGDPSGVTEEGGMIEQQMFELEIEVSPINIPNLIQADVTIMTLDRSLSVADLPLPAGVVSLVAEDVSVVAPVIPRAAKADDGDAEVGEDGEPIAGESAEGGDAEGSDSGTDAADDGGE